ncbi:nitroreductase/quinone reductase family protein [Amycolatopsis sp. NPDC049252]|uniref:nitroreductase/quinone reductase family protein n=1 Tax=Amycolatopsis sp. NPDC049252 TaxID=3363933 RepID=UPI00371FDD05
MSDTISRRIPPQRLITAMNPLVRAIAGSPLHRLLGTSVLVLHVTGRRTGRHYDIPVGFADLGDTLLVVTRHRWRVNLRGTTAVSVTHRGHTRRMHAQLTEDPAAVAVRLGEAITRLGRKNAQRRFGLALPDDRDPGPAELEAAIREYSLATITLRDDD